MSANFELEGRPFAELLAAIDVTVSGDDLEAQAALLRRLWGSPDHTPAAHALARCAASGALATPPVAAALLDGLLCLPDAGVKRILDGLSGPAGRAAAPPVIEAMGRLGAARISALSIMARWLSRVDPAAWADLKAQARAEIEAALLAQGEISDASLMILPGAEVAALAVAHPTQASAFEARREALAAEILSTLAARPRTASQAGAEALLSEKIYTDPGHCLVELLQNAEDAGARTWRVARRGVELHVSHDGAPFDPRDVVGVLSIGQTTKGAEQIGMFGVGFKAVYAICERPRLYSDVYAFEIADVSIPRPMTDAAPTPPWTRLILPLRRPEDPVVGLEAMWRRVEALPPSALLALRQIERLQRIDAEGARAEVRRVEIAPGRVALEATGPAGSWRQAWRVATGPGGALAAAPLDEAGRPTPLPADDPTVFCFLPTAARPGWRLMIHGRFEIPVDRERLDPQHPTNRAALTDAGRAFAALARGCPVEDRLALLALLPPPARLAPGGWAVMAEAFKADLGGLPLVGEASAAQIILAPGPLARALGDLSLGGRRVIDEAAPGAETLAWLGARRWSEPICLAAVAEVTWPAAAIAPLIRWAASDAVGMSAEGLARLGALPWLRDEAGAPRPPSALIHVEGVTRALLAPLRPILPARWASLAGADFWAALGVEAPSPEAVAEIVLAAPAQGAEAGCWLRWLSAYEHALSASTLRRVAEAPLYESDRGLRPVRGADGRRLALGDGGALMTWLQGVPGAPSVAGASSAAHRDLLRRLGAVEISAEGVIAAIDDGALRPDDEALLALHGWLAGALDELSGQIVRQGARAALWLDAAGARRPLIGPERALLPGDEAARRWRPEAPWLDARLCALGHGERAGGEIIASRQIVAALAGRPGALPPSLPLASEAERGAALRWLAEAPSLWPTLDEALTQALADAPVWPQADGEAALAPLSLRRAPAEDAEIAALYQAASAAPWALLPARAAAPTLWALIDGLGLTPPPTDHLRLLADLPALLTLGEAWTPALERAVCASAASCPPEALQAARVAPWWPDTAGEVGPLAAPGGVWPGGDLALALEAAGIRALEPEAAARRRPIIEALAVGPPPLAAVLARWRGGLGAEALRRAVTAPGALAALPGEIVEALPTLPLWLDGAGASASASALILAGALPAGAPTPPEAARLDAAQEAALRARLDLSGGEPPAALGFRSWAAWLEGEIEAHGRLGEPLSAQPPWLSTVDQVAQLAGAVPGAVIAVDGAGRLVVGPVHACDEDTRAVTAGLPLVARLAHEAWPQPAAPLSLRQILHGLQVGIPEAEIAPSESPLPTLRTAEGRQRMYRWIFSRREALAADEGALAQLCALPVCLSAAGQLRAPRALLWRGGALPELPELKISAPDREVPEGLARWFDAHGPRPQGAMRRAAERLLDEHEAAMGRRDLDASVALATALARVLAVDARLTAGVEQAAQAEAQAAERARLQEQIQRLKIHRRLKIADSRGEFVRPRDLLSPADAAHEGLIAAFMEQPPAGPHRAYSDPALRRLIQLAGADDGLSEETLRALLDGRGRRPGPEASRALAIYLCHRILERRGLIDALGLRQRPWAPSAEGELAAPGALYWPDPALDALIGAAHPRRLHPQVAAALGVEAAEALAVALGGRQAAGARLADVLAAQGDGPASAACLSWLEARLSAGDLEMQAARQEIAGLRFEDDDGVARPSGELIRDLPPDHYGPWRGGWRAGRALPKLTQALGLPIAPSPATDRRWLGWIMATHTEKGARWLQGTPGWVESYLDRMGDLALAGAPPPSPWGLPVDVGGSITLWAAPAALALDPEAPGPVALAPAGVEPEVWRRWLEAHDPAQASVQPPEEAPSAPEPSGASEGPGLWSALRRLWDRGDGAPKPEAPKTQRPQPQRPQSQRPQPQGPQPPQPQNTGAQNTGAQGGLPDDQRWFQQRAAVDPQLSARPDWLSDRHRQSRYGVAFRPGRLPLPYTYGPNLIADRLNRRSQRWTAEGVEASWASPAAGAGIPLQLQGRLPSGRIRLPLPLYGRLVEITDEAGAPIQVDVSDPDAPAVHLLDEAAVRYTVALGPAPRFDEGCAVPTLPKHRGRALLQPTAPDHELPAPCHSLINEIALAPPLARVQAIRAFIMDHYRYDPSHLEDPARARWLARVSAGRANVHLAALHAGRDAHHLGRGVCYELNTLACELMRRAGVPAAIATGWTFDRGQVDEPDHLWAMALLETDEGPRWMPVDASTTRQGRPIHARPRSGGVQPPKAAPAALPKAPAWASAKAPKAAGAAIPLTELLAVARYMADGADEAALRDRCRALLADPAGRAALQALFEDAERRR